MVLSIAEYDFVILYLKGARNVLADFGTRQLDPEEWEEESDPDDPLGIASLFTHDITAPFLSEVVDTPHFSHDDLAVEDFNEIEHYSLQSRKQDGILEVYHDRVWLTFIPTSL